MQELQYNSRNTDNCLETIYSFNEKDTSASRDKGQTRYIKGGSHEMGVRAWE